MRVLVILRSAWRNDNNTGNTMTNFFSDIDAEFYSISFRDKIPQNEIAIENFAISEIQILKSIFKGEKTGLISKREDYDTLPENAVETNAEDKMYGIAKKSQSYLLFFARECIWKTGKWKTDKLDEYIKKVNPDVIFMQTFNCVYPYRVLRYVQKNSDAKVILFNFDDNYTLRQISFNPIYWIYRLYLRRYIRRAINDSSVSYVISEVQRDEYGKLFNKDFNILTKFENFDLEPELKTDCNSPLKFVFTGNISSNRWKTLADIASEMKKINENGVKAQLYIYSAAKLTKRMEKALEIPDTSFFMGAVPSSEIPEIQKNADVLVHVEAMDFKNRKIIHQSFSTKLVDYMKSARMIFAVGPGDAASIKHLKDNDAAIAVTSKKEIRSAICRITENPLLVKEYAEKSYECGRRFHNKNTMQEMLEKDMHSVIEK